MVELLYNNRLVNTDFFVFGKCCSDFVILRVKPKSVSFIVAFWIQFFLYCY